MNKLKSAVRKCTMELRESLSLEQVDTMSKTIMNKLIELPEFKSALTVMSYMDFRNEVKTRDIISYCLSNGKRVAAPRVDNINDSGRKQMVLYEINNMDSDFEPGTFGVTEPKRDKNRVVEPDEIDLVLVPGLVFDRNGNRIGFGAGYYDQFLVKTRNDCIKAAVAFDLQVLDDIPAEEHDIPMDIIITESNIIYCTKG